MPDSEGNQLGIYIGIGSNLGDRAANIRAALAALTVPGDVAVVRCSSLHETRPEGGPPGQPLFLNAAAEVATSLRPRALLSRLLDVERSLGRRRGAPNGPRTIDLDLLVYHRLRIDEPDLVVPHPRMWQRSFVLLPLSEICDVAELRREFRVETAHVH
ncbi:MAG: hypothetical protein AMXMBFR47_01510 [Planctomycetota bacterium]